MVMAKTRHFKFIHYRQFIYCTFLLAAPFVSIFAEIVRNSGPVAQVVGTTDELSEGYYAFSMYDGIYISPLKEYAPVKVPNTEPDREGHFCLGLDISDDGQWIVYAYTPPMTGQGTENSSVFLIRPDGTGKTAVISDKTPGAAAGFVHNSPFNDEIWHASGNVTTEWANNVYYDEITGVQVDLSGTTATLGTRRTIARMNEQAFENYWEKRTTVAGDRIHFGLIQQPRSAVIPDNGQGTATTFQAMYNAPCCGIDMSWDGRYCVVNMNNHIADLEPVGEHKGPTLYEFITHPLRNENYVSQNKAPDEYAVSGNDWHYWDFTNNSDYLACVNQYQRNNLVGPTGYREYWWADTTVDGEGIGLWILNWKTNRWVRVSSRGVRSNWIVAFFSPDGTRNALPSPIGSGALPVMRNSRSYALLNGISARRDAQQHLMTSYRIDGRFYIQANGRALSNATSAQILHRSLPRMGIVVSK